MGLYILSTSVWGLLGIQQKKNQFRAGVLFFFGGGGGWVGTRQFTADPGVHGKPALFAPPITPIAYQKALG